MFRTYIFVTRLYRSLNAILAQPKNCPFGVNTMAEHKKKYSRQYRHLVRYVSTNKCAGVVRCNYYSFELSRSINSTWANLGCATIAFIEQYVHLFNPFCILSYFRSMASCKACFSQRVTSAPLSIYSILSFP